MPTRNRPDPPEQPLHWPEVMTAQEVAAYLRISYLTVLRMTHGGHLNAIRVGREFRYLRSEIDRLMRQPAPPATGDDAQR